MKVVGAGVIGLAAGAALKLPVYGLLPTEQRVFAFSPRSVAFLQGLGAWGSYPAQAYSHLQVWEHNPAHALHLPGKGWIVSQADVLSALRPKVQLYEQRIDNLDGFTVIAEGVQSLLREQAGLHLPRQPYDQRGYVFTARFTKPAQDCAYQRFLPTGPLALLPLVDGAFSVVWSSSQPLSEDLSAALEQATQGVCGKVLEVSAVQSWPLQVGIAPQWFSKEAVLVGDSAHVIHPLAGQGMNLGLNDVEVLARQLVSKPLVRALAAYQRERMAAAEDLKLVTDGLYRLYRSPSPSLGLLRGWGLTHLPSAARLWLAGRAEG